MKNINLTRAILFSLIVLAGSLWSIIYAKTFTNPVGSAYWNSKIGQPCSITFQEVGNTQGTAEGVIKSVDGDWVVIENVSFPYELENDKVKRAKEVAIPTKVVHYISFDQ